MRRYFALRTLLFLAVFMVFHNLYVWSPNLLTRIFSGSEEVFIEHAKIGMWTATILAIGEYVFGRARGHWEEAEKVGSFVSAQGLAVSFLPWIMFIFWYTVPTWIGPLPSVAWDIIYSIAMTAWLGLLIAIIGQEFRKVKFSPGMQVLVLVMYLLALFLLVTFSFRTPWAPFFST